MVNSQSHTELAVFNAKKGDISWPIWLIYIFIITPTFLPVGVESILMGYFVFFPLIAWSVSRKAIPSYIVYLTLPLTGIIAIGLVGFINNPAFDVMKDIWYVGNAILTLLTGFILMYNLKDFRRLAKAFVIAGVFVSLLHLFKFVLHPEYLSLPTNDLRNVAGRGNLISILGIGLLTVFWAIKSPLFVRYHWISYIAFIIFLASTWLSYSREALISLVFLIACVYGWVDFRNTKRLIKIIIAVLMLASIILIIPPPQSSGQHATLIDKLLYSASELKVKDYSSIQSINDNWRGYETARALKTYNNGEYWQYVIGQGFGTTIDLGLYMQLGEDKIRFAPILHNGYMYLLVKTGIIGLGLYLWLIILLIRLGTDFSHKSDIESKYTGRLIAGMGFIIMISTYVIAGLLNKQVLIPVSLLTGALIAHASNLRYATPKKQQDE